MSEAPPPPAEVETLVAEEGEERLQGHSPRGMAASAVMVSLSRAARSFLLYDPSNEAIRHFLQNLQRAADAYFAIHGPLDLQVRPFELAMEGEIVYLDRDRERSLAFRLFRDGVRRVTLLPAITWHELLKFLEVISIRYTGIRQTEDDMVVLLWKAGFQHIQVEAVEGLIADDDAGSDTAIRAQSGTFAGAPEEFDLPAPDFPGDALIGWAEVPESVRARLAEEDSTQAVPDLCVRLTEELIIAASMPDSGIPFRESLPALRELRDFLLGEGTLLPLLETVRFIEGAILAEPADREACASLAASFVDAAALARLLRSVPRESIGASAEMMSLLDLLPGDHLQTVLTVLGVEKGEAARRAARTIIEKYVPVSGDWLVEQVATFDADVASEVLRALAHANMDLGLAAAERIISRPDMEIQFEVLHLLARAPLGPTLARLCSTLVASPHDEVRLRAQDLVRTRAIQGVFRALHDHVKRSAPLRLDPREAAVAGEAMARSDESLAFAAFRDWARPPGFWSVVLPGHVRLHYVAVAGLAILPGEEAEKLITAIKGRSDADLQQFCVRTMIERRKRMRGTVQ